MVLTLQKCKIPMSAQAGFPKNSSLKPVMLTLYCTQMLQSSLFYCFLAYKIASIHAPGDKLFSSIWECPDFPFIPERYFHLVQDLGLTVPFFQHLKNITPLPSNFCGFWWDIYYHSNSFFLIRNAFSLAAFKMFPSFWVCHVWPMFKLFESVGLHLLPNLGSFQPLILLIFFQPLPTFTSFSRTTVTQMLDILLYSHSFWGSVHYFFPVCFLPVVQIG